MDSRCRVSLCAGSERYELVLTSSQYRFAGLKLEGAAWSTSHLILNDGSTTGLERSSLVWLDAASNAAPASAASTVPVTLYLNADRDASLFNITLPAAQGLAVSTVAQRAVALRAA